MCWKICAGSIHALTEIKTLAEDIDKRHVQLLARKQDEAENFAMLQSEMQGQRQVCDHTVGAKEQLMKDWDENWKIYAVETENQAEDGRMIR